VVGAHSVITSGWSTTLNLWRGSLLPLGCAAAPKRPAHSYRKTAAPPSESKLPCPESWALRRLVYSPCAMLPPSYESLRHCLQLRQNPPACAPCSWVLSFPCHCPSVVGFSSPRFSARCMSYPLRQVFQFLSLMVAVRRALRRAGNAGIPGLLTCVQPPPFF
jgi:hypothetical protein